MRPHWFKRHPKIVLAAAAGTCTALVFMTLEGVLAILLIRPQLLMSFDFLRDGLRRIYIEEDWSVVQADLDMVEYDPEVTYLLTPTASRHVNREFDTTIRGNSAGLRDDEASLTSPDVIVLGDSYAMGWGVEQEEAFPQALEKKTGLTKSVECGRFLFWYRSGNAFTPAA